MEDCRKLSDEELAGVTGGATIDLGRGFAAYLTNPGGQVMLLNTEKHLIKVFDSKEAYWAWVRNPDNLYAFLEE